MVFFGEFLECEISKWWHLHLTFLFRSGGLLTILTGGETVMKSLTLVIISWSSRLFFVVPMSISDTMEFGRRSWYIWHALSVCCQLPGNWDRCRISSICRSCPKQNQWISIAILVVIHLFWISGTPKCDILTMLRWFSQQTTITHVYHSLHLSFVATAAVLGSKALLSVNAKATQFWARILI